VHPLVIDVQALALDKDIQAAVTEPPALTHSEGSHACDVRSEV
jgi:hypothetical protein